MSEQKRRNWFDQGGSGYAKFRPDYPPELAEYLATLAPQKTLAVDVGCGNGQLTTQLAKHFDQVQGVDDSADQVANAASHERVEYFHAPAENLPLADNSAQLITVAQAAHWLDLPQFYEQAKRIAAPQARLALVSYGILHMEADLSERFDHFYWNEVGPYWPPQRKLVESGYADVPFPFEEIEPAKLEIRKAWTLDQFLGYLTTWSAVRRAREQGREDILDSIFEDLTAQWGDPERERIIRWPINMRIGQL